MNARLCHSCSHRAAYDTCGRAVTGAVGAGQVVAAAAATDLPIGVLQNNPTSGTEASVTIVGGTKIVASAAATLGTALNFGTSATGKAATLAVSDTTKYVLGVYLEAPAADGDIVAAVINCANPTRAN